MEYCSCSVTQLCLTLCDPVNSSTSGFPTLYYLTEFVQTHVHWVSDAIQPSHPLSSPSIRIFSNESAIRIRWQRYWSFSFSISPSNEYLGFIYFGVDWFGLLAVQRTLKSLVQDNTSKASIFLCSAFFMVQLLHLYMTTGKTIALTIQTLSAK